MIRRLVDRPAVAALAATLGALAAGCGGAQARSVASPAGPAARILAALGLPVLIGFVVTSVVMWGLVAWVALRRTGSLAEHAPPDAEGGLGWVVIGGFIIPGVVFFGIFLATLGVMRVFPMDHGARGKAEIRVIGHQWWWQIDYVAGGVHQQFTTANEIHIPVGRPIEIELDSADVIHSLWAPRLHGKVDLVPGLVNHIRIQADAPGVYPGGCAEFCGLQHAKMRFLVIAESPADYKKWLEHEREGAVTPTEPAALRGREVFMNGPCPMCHTVTGTPALATVGPNLTHFGSRLTVASGWRPNELGAVHAWVVNAQSIKPGVEMPMLTFFHGPELHDLVAYLEALK
jgi:cytochrome c oxidase subunit 2